MSKHVFTYGSLMFASVWQRVVQGSYRSEAATLAGYTRFALAEETYPGIVADTAGQVAGLVYFDVDAADLAALDRFEGDEYRRCTVDVSSNALAPVCAETYVMTALHRLSDQPWDPQGFALQRFLAGYCRDKTDV